VFLCVINVYLFICIVVYSLLVIYF